MISSALNAQFIQDNTKSLFSDVKAFKEGDAIMVLIMEDMQANNGSSSSNERSTNYEGGVGLGLGTGSSAYDARLGTSRDFDATGETGRTERIRTRLSARVLSVEDNGNLKIEGTRTTKINGETQTVIIRGVVRPVDVQPDNSVLSYNILDITLLIEGEGQVTEVQEPGLITKFLRFLF